MKPPIEARPIHDTNHPIANLEVLHLEAETYLVRGGSEPHWVYYNGRLGMCDCGDFIWRDTVCKHLSAVHHA